MKCLVLALACFVPSLVPSAQTTIPVPGGAPTIQGAIVLAQDGDTVLVSPGTYPEGLDFLGKAITVASTDGASVTTIDAATVFDSAVIFHSGEGPGSVLRGFTVRGGNGSQLAGGISCFDGTGSSTPLVQQCVIRENRTSLGSAGGVDGDPTLEDCLIEDNHCPYQSGGIAGSPTVRRCTIRGNHGYEGGGMYLFGGRVSDSVIVENVALEGTAGGGVLLAGPAVLERCLIARNSSQALGFYRCGAGGVSASPFFAGTMLPPPRLVSCTVVENHIVQPYQPHDDSAGGVEGHVVLIDTLVRDNDDHDVTTVDAALFCNIRGGYAGPGNFDADPLFRDAAHGDYRLLPGSPCIDTGAQWVPLDADGSRADIGAFAFAHAVAFVRNGRGVNPLLLSSATPPAIGTTWDARIDASLVPGTTLSGITARTQAREPGVVLPQGEVLVSGARLFTFTQASSGVTDDFLLAIPSDTSLLGFELHAQGFASAGGLHLGNALRVLVGE